MLQHDSQVKLDERQSKLRVVVLGSGTMGLATAFQAVRDGHDVTVLEADTQAGGMAAHFDFGGVSMERFYHFICKTDYSTFELLRDLKIEDQLRWRETSMGLFAQGKLHDWGNPIALLRFPGMKLLDKLRYGLFVFIATKRNTWPSLEHRNAKEWVTTWCGASVYKMYWESLFQYKFHEHQDDISASWLWTRIKRLGRSRKTMMKEELGYIEGGSETLVKALVMAIEEAGGKVLLGNAARRVLVEGGKVTGVDTPGGVFPADRVISTVPVPFVSKLIPDLSAAAREKYDSISNIGICCLIYKLRRSLSRHFLVNLAQPEIEIPGLIEFSNLRKMEETIVYIPYYLPTGNEKFSWPDEKLLAEAFLAMQAIQPALEKSDILDSHVARLRYAQPICTPGFAARLPPVQTEIQGLQVADTCFYYPEDRGIAESVRIGRKMARDL